MENGLLNIDIPSCNSDFILHSVEGVEEISALFKFTLSLQVTENNSTVNAQDLIGKEISFQINKTNQQPRYFNGIISEFSISYSGSMAAPHYSITVVPWLWFLTQETDSRVFQDKTAIEIIETIFRDHNFKNYNISAVTGSGKQRKQDYCVQHQETTFAFISRVMEEEGVFYYFTHAKHQHTIILSDNSLLCKNCAAEVVYNAASRADNSINHWQRNYQFQSNKIVQLDYNFITPNSSLLVKTAVAGVPQQPECELFSYPGDYETVAVGNSKAKHQAEAIAASCELIGGAGDYLAFASGLRFNLVRHDYQQEQGEYLLIAAQHIANQALGYRNSFSCIPAQVSYRPKRKTYKPIIAGVQSAVVVGSAGQDLYVDQYGRVKVQFHWDRRGNNNEYSSCWARVMQTADSQFIPKVGEEVLVGFVNGNPDRPLIIGAFFNAKNRPIYQLPQHKTQAGIKSKSGNQLRFEDKTGQEEIFLHAQKDFTKTIDGNESTTIKNGKFTLQAAQAIELKVGGNSIVIDSAGITEKGPKVSID